MIKTKKKKNISENFLEKKFLIVSEELLRKKEKIIDITITTKTEEKIIKKSFVAVPQLKLELEKFKKRNERFETIRRFNINYRNNKIGNLKFFVDKQIPKNIGISIFLLPMKSEIPIISIIKFESKDLVRILKKLIESLEKYKEESKERGRKIIAMELLKELQKKIEEIEELNTENLKNNKEIIQNELKDLFDLYLEIIKKREELNELIKKFVEKSIEILEINNEKIQKAMQDYYFFLSNGMSREEALLESLKINDLSEAETKRFLKLVIGKLLE